jgi:hypothetical protein
MAAVRGPRETSHPRGKLVQHEAVHVRNQISEQNGAGVKRRPTGKRIAVLAIT